MKNIIESINKLFLIKEATSDSGSRGSYVAPLMPGFKKFSIFRRAIWTFVWW